MSTTEMMKLVPGSYVERINQQISMDNIEYPKKSYLKLLFRNETHYLNEELKFNHSIKYTHEEYLHMNMAISRRYKTRRSFLKTIMKRILLPDLVMDNITRYIGLEQLSDVFKIVV